MILELEETWPKDLIAFLNREYDMLMAQANHNKRVMEEDAGFYSENPYFDQNEQTASKVLDMLQSTTLLGWHCTRLTKSEVEDIAQNGMQLPNLELLENRISQLQSDGLISEATAMRLKTENQANDYNRKNRIWFCFFPPRFAGQSGIERFFRRWGGEALYNSHEQDAETGKVLTGIGEPCLIEANVPISAFGSVTWLGDKVIRRYLVNRGLQTDEPLEHEDKSREPIKPENISRFIFHGDAEFSELTGCDQWIPPL